MHNVINFFTDINTDIFVAFDPRTKGQPTDIQEKRIASIALRILGSATALYTTVSFLSTIGLIAGSPLAALALLVSTSIEVILAHDLIQTGYNLRTQFVFSNPLSTEDPVEATKQVLKDVTQVGTAVVQEAITGTPTLYHNTWFFELAFQKINAWATQMKHSPRTK